MRQITFRMLQVYGKDRDWMNYRINKEVTAHHIVKREDGGKLEWDNIALLIPTSHEYLHIIEYKDEMTYKIINKLFKSINEQMREPTLKQRQMMEYLLMGFECEYSKEINAKGRLLIKEKYLKR